MENSVSKTQPWTIKEIDQAVKENGSGTEYVKVPRFQRTLVWGEDQRRKLVDSLYRGYPIGAILGYQTGEKKGTRNVVQIVDGLQRITSIHEYSKKPLFYAPSEAIFDDQFVADVHKQIASVAPNIDQKAIRGRLSSWLVKTMTTQMADGFNSESLIAAISEKSAEALGVLEKQTNMFNAKLDWIREKVSSVESIQVPVVLYSGNIGNIPEIFERINSQGTGLTKYEILASSWATTQVHVSNPQIREAVVDKYNVLKDEGYEIDGLPESGSIGVDEHNLYEYLFGLGKVLTDKFPILFGESGKPDAVDPHGFVIFTTALGLRLSNMSDLQKAWSEKFEPGKIDPSKLEYAIFESCEEITRALKPFLTVRLNKKHGTTGILHSQNQICALVSAYLVKRFSGKNWTDSGSHTAQSIKENAPAHYLLDILGKRWRGSGDSRLFETTWDSDGSAPSNYYEKGFSENYVREALTSWHEEELESQQRKRAPISNDSKAILYFVYSGLISVLNDQSEEYEIEHLYPVSVLAGVIQKSGGEGWPISALGNLMLLPKKLNRIKQRNMLGDYLPMLLSTSEITAQEVSAIQKYLIAPNFEEITESSSTSRAKYISFCEKRLAGIADHLVHNLISAKALSNS